MNERELVGLAMPDLALDHETLVRIEKAKILLGRFPYVRNYELMLHAELAMLQQPLGPRFARERKLAGDADGVDEALIERWDRAIAGITSVVGAPWRGLISSRGSSPSQGRKIAICGSGPLPMTALFLHLMTGAAVILVDHDRSAIERSKRLIGILERLGILEPDTLTVRQENAGHVTFHDPGKPSSRSRDASVACDAVMIARPDVCLGAMSL